MRAGGLDVLALSGLPSPTTDVLPSTDGLPKLSRITQLSRDALRSCCFSVPDPLLKDLLKYRWPAGLESDTSLSLEAKELSKRVSGAGID